MRGGKTGWCGGRGGGAAWPQDPPARPPWKCFSLGDALLWIETASEALFFLCEADGRTRVGLSLLPSPPLHGAGGGGALAGTPGAGTGSPHGRGSGHHLKPQDFPYLLRHS